MSRRAEHHVTKHVRRLRIAEGKLLDGATLEQLAQAIRMSERAKRCLHDKTIRRLIGSLEQLGLQVTRTQPDGPSTPAVFRAARASRIFRQVKP